MERRSFLQWSSLAAGSAAMAGILGKADQGLSHSTPANPSAAQKIAPLPTSDEELIYTPATDLVKLFKTKQVSPVDVLNAQLKQIEAVNGEVNAITHTHVEEAMAAAQESEKRYLQGNPRPLEGITVALKDEYDKEGWITTAGSVLLKDNVATKNHPAVDKLIKAGAVMHIQTTVPEMYLAGVTWTDLWGVTRNPWNLDYTVGGSSGGSGAALAAGMTTLATGSDMGGSTRIPCAFNGLYGFKAPYARNAPPAGAVFLLPSSEGPMARTFKDMVLLQNVMVGPAPYTVTSLRPAIEYPLSYDGIKGMRIAYTLDQGWAQVDADTRQNTEDALKVLESQGAIVEAVEFDFGLTGPEIREALVKALLSGAFGADMAQLADYSEYLTTYGRYFAEIAARDMGPQQAKEAAEAINALYAKVQDTAFLQGYDAIVMPTLATSNIAADFDPTADSVLINGVEVDPHVGWMLTPLWNLLNWNPVVVVPSGLDRNNMPTGLQIATKTYDDLTAFQIASAYSEAASPLFSNGRYPDFRK
ncbi:MAG: amidase [Cyanobacteria bacterium P01_H01_bin.15]